MRGGLLHGEHFHHAKQFIRRAMLEDVAELAKDSFEQPCRIEPVAIGDRYGAFFGEGGGEMPDQCGLARERRSL